VSVEEELRAAVATFVVEAAELLAEMESGLLELERGADGDEVVNAVFRAAHTIKGSAGLFGLDDIVAFTHVLESVLDRVRAGEIAISAELVASLLPCRDHLVVLCERVAAGQTAPDPRDLPIGEELLGRLRGYLAEPDGPGRAGDGTPGDGTPAAPVRPVHLSLRFGPDSLRNGMDPISFIHYLSVLGEVSGVTTMDELLPQACSMDPEACYLAFQVTLRTDANLGTVAEVFDFVRDDGDIRVLDSAAGQHEIDDLVASFGPLGSRVLELVERSGIVPVPGLSGLPVPGGTVPGGSGPAGSVTVPGARQAPEGRPGERGGHDIRTIRVDAARLDRLIDTVGELVIAGAGAAECAQRGGEELRAAIGEVTRLIEGVRDGALRLRMVPIGTTFGRFQRVVHDVGAALGKDVSLVISGGDTEVDKAVVEHIGDPLMHLVRNALDHGIESPAERVAAGKPAQGTLELRAFHDSGSIVVVVTDDGRGIDPDRVLATARERGLVEPDATPSESDVYALLFEPGFSTAQQVSDLSGRGVGMDVVKRNVVALRGGIEVSSTPGAGTSVRIRLPLTLAIIDGFMVGVGATTFVVPLDQVIECVAVPPDGRGRDYLDLRGEVLPLIRLRQLMAVPGVRPARENVVVVEHAGVRTGLVVDTLRGEFQTVIKPLGPLFARVRGVGGSTILGNGEVALIIDVAALVRHVMAGAAPAALTPGG
jgi:two-component system chemotaxis sensor kinase CheA